MSCIDMFRDLRFLLKVVNLILNTVILILWLSIAETKSGAFKPFSTGMVKESQQILFAHTVPAYMIVLGVMVILWILQEEPGKWSVRLYNCAGAVLFLVTGIQAIINYTDDRYKYFIEDKVLVNSILCIAIAVIMVVDILKSENVF